MISYSGRHRLPKKSGIYRLKRWNLLGGTVLYVGQSINLHQRWNATGERRHQYLGMWQREHGNIQLDFEPCWPCNLDYREAVAIQRLNPRLNKLRPKPQWTPLVLAEDIWRALPWVGVVAIAALVILR
jgi:hypothetical protein